MSSHFCGAIVIQSVMKDWVFSSLASVSSELGTRRKNDCFKSLSLKDISAHIPFPLSKHMATRGPGHCFQPTTACYGRGRANSFARIHLWAPLTCRVYASILSTSSPGKTTQMYIFLLFTELKIQVNWLMHSPPHRCRCGSFWSSSCSSWRIPPLHEVIQLFTLP